MKDALTGNKGQGVLEIVIALGILSIALASAIVLVFGGQSLLIDTQLSQQALQIAMRNLEATQVAAGENFDGLTSSSSTAGQFFEEIVVENAGSETKKITSRVSWQIDPARVQKVEFSALATNWRLLKEFGGDSCGGGITGDWQNPRTGGTIDLGPGNEATGLDVVDKIVYLSATASDSKKKDFYIVDATVIGTPVILSSIDTGPGPCPTDCGSGLHAVDVAGNYAYVGNSSTTSQLQIIDVSNKSNPLLVTSFTLPGVSGAGAVGESVFYSNARVYIGTKEAAGPEFHIIDVSNPSAPVALGSKEFGRDIHDIFVSGTTAYIANAHSNEIRALDVSNPSSITEITSYDPGGSSAGKSVYRVGNRLYVGRLRVTGAGSEFHVFDITSSSTILNAGSKELDTDINDIIVNDYLAFLATSDANKEFQILNVSDPTNILVWGTFNFPQVATSIDCENNIVYMSVRSNDALRIITSQ